MPRGAPKGNRNSVGKGRKGAGLEFRNAQTLWDIWTSPEKKAEIEKRMASGTETLQDIFHSLGYEGNARTLTAMFNKIYPNTHEIDAKVELDFIEMDEKKYADIIRREARRIGGGGKK